MQRQAAGTRPRKPVNTLRLRRRVGGVLFGLFRFLILFGLIFLIVYPFLFMFVTAFRGYEDLNDPSVVWITRHYTLDNFRQFLSMVDFGDMMGNTLVISLSCAVLQTFVCGLAGYGFARFRFRGRSLLFGLLLFTIIVPPQTYISQLFVLFRYFEIPAVSPLLGLFLGPVQWNTLNTPLPFILPALFGMGLRSGLFIYIYRQFFRGLPGDLEDAARIDGSSAMRTYFAIMLPNAKPAMVTVFMLSLVWNWNDAFSQTFLSMSRTTVAVFLTQIRGQISTLASGAQFDDPTYLYILIQSGALLCICPLLILFLFGQKFFTESIERTGIVG